MFPSLPIPFSQHHLRCRLVVDACTSAHATKHRINHEERAMSKSRRAQRHALLADPSHRLQASTERLEFFEFCYFVFISRSHDSLFFQNNFQWFSADMNCRLASSRLKGGKADAALRPAYSFCVRVEISCSSAKRRTLHNPVAEQQQWVAQQHNQSVRSSSAAGKAGCTRAVMDEPLLIDRRLHDVVRRLQLGDALVLLLGEFGRRN